MSAADYRGASSNASDRLTTLLLELEQRLQRLVLELQQQERPLLVQHLQQVQLLEFRPQEPRLQRLELHRENDRLSRRENVELLLRQQHQNRLQQRHHQLQLCSHSRYIPK